MWSHGFHMYRNFGWRILLWGRKCLDDWNPICLCLSSLSIHQLSGSFAVTHSISFEERGAKHFLIFRNVFEACVLGRGCRSECSGEFENSFWMEWRKVASLWTRWGRSERNFESYTKRRGFHDITSISRISVVHAYMLRFLYAAQISEIFYIL